MEVHDIVQGTVIKTIPKKKKSKKALNMLSNLGILAVATRLEKVSFHSNPKERQCQKCSKYLHNTTNIVMLKILQARFQQYMNCELPDVQAGYRKVEEPEIKLPTSVGSLKKQENSRRTSTSASLTMPKPLTVWITTDCGKFLEMGIPDHITCLLRK